MQPSPHYRLTTEGGHLGPHPDRFVEAFHRARALSTISCNFSKYMQKFDAIHKLKREKWT